MNFSKNDIPCNVCITRSICRNKEEISCKILYDFFKKEGYFKTDQNTTEECRKIEVILSILFNWNNEYTYVCARDILGLKSVVITSFYRLKGVK